MPPDGALHEKTPTEEPIADAVSGGAGALTADDKQWGMFAHLAVFLGLVAAGLTFIGPLIVWLAKKDQSRFVDYHGKESLNFQLNVLIYSLILVAISLATCGFGVFVTAPLLGALFLFGIIMPILAGLAANRGEMYRYPLTFRMIK
jgi:uncharacterized Tic20 family protein